MGKLIIILFFLNTLLYAQEIQNQKQDTNLNASIAKKVTKQEKEKTYYITENQIKNIIKEYNEDLKKSLESKITTISEKEIIEIINKHSIDSKSSTMSEKEIIEIINKHTVDPKSYFETSYNLTSFWLTVFLAFLSIIGSIAVFLGFSNSKDIKKYKQEAEAGANKIKEYSAIIEAHTKSAINSINNTPEEAFLSLNMNEVRIMKQNMDLYDISKDDYNNSQKFKKAIIYYRLGHINEALKLLEDIAFLEDSKPIYIYNLGVIYEEKSEYTKAKDAYRKAIEKGFVNEMVYIALGNLQILENELESAEDTLLSGLKKIDYLSDAYIIKLAELHIKKQNLSEAENAMKLVKDKNSETYLYDMACLNALQNNIDESKKFLIQVIKIDNKYIKVALNDPELSNIDDLETFLKSINNI